MHLRFAVLAIALVACGKEQAAPAPTTGTVDWTGVCQKYASRCDAKSTRTAESLAKRNASCEQHCTADGFKAHLEECSFVYCGVETSLCDNEEPGDAKILACVKQHGWR